MNEAALERAIYEKSKRQLTTWILGFISYAVAVFLWDWLRWVTGFFLVLLLLGEINVLHLLRLHQRSSFPFASDTVARNHLVMGYACLALTVYSLLGLSGNLPLPALTMLLAALISLVHCIGYGYSASG